MTAPRQEAFIAFSPNYTPSIVNPYTGVTSAYGGLVASVSVTSSTTAAASAILANVGMLDTRADYTQIQIANTTTAWAYVNWGVFGNITAATVAASYPVAPGAVVVVTVATEVTGFSVILGAAPGTNTAVIFTRGQGL